jgi:putative transposase
MEKVAPSARFRAELDEVLAGVAGEEDPIETVGRLGARLILQQALEDEVTEFLGRGRYERAEETVAHRNGHEPRAVKTTAGPMRLERPRVRDASKLGFESRVLGKGVVRTHALESLVISGFLRGLSTRDVEAALEEVFEEPVASKSTVSRICEDTRERYRQWCRRRLETHDIVYLFLDAIYLKLHPDDTPAEGVLVCWGVTLEGRKILLGLALGSRESYESWLSFGRDLIDRASGQRDRSARSVSSTTQAPSRSSPACVIAQCQCSSGVLRMAWRMVSVSSYPTLNCICPSRQRSISSCVADAESPRTTISTSGSPTIAVGSCASASSSTAI